MNPNKRNYVKDVGISFSEGIFLKNQKEIILDEFSYHLNDIINTCGDKEFIKLQFNMKLTKNDELYSQITYKYID